MFLTLIEKLIAYHIQLPASYLGISAACKTMFSPVQLSMTVSNSSQTLIKRSLTSSCSSIQSPIQLSGTPFCMQHCSKSRCRK